MAESASPLRTRAQVAAYVEQEVRAYFSDTERSQPFRRWATVSQWPSAAERTISYIGELASDAPAVDYSYRIALKQQQYRLPLDRVKDWPQGVAGRRVMARNLTRYAIHGIERIVQRVTLGDTLEANAVACDGKPLFCAERGNLLTGSMDHAGLDAALEWAATTAGDPFLNPSRAPLCYPLGQLLVPSALHYEAAQLTHINIDSFASGTGWAGYLPVRPLIERGLRDPNAYYLLPEPQYSPVAVVIPRDDALNARVTVEGRFLRVTFELGAAVANPWGACKVVLPAATQRSA